MRFAKIMILAVALLALLPLGTGSSAGRPLRVAVLPFTVHSVEDLSYLQKGIWDIISSRIIVEGEIEAVEKPLIERFLADLRGGDISDQQARWLGNRVGADYAVYGSITKVGDYISLDAKIVHVPGQRATTSAFAQHKGIDEVMTKVGAFAQDISSRLRGRTTSYERGGTGHLRENLMFQAVGYSKLMTFPKQVLTGVDAGDVDGDGKNEVVVASLNKISLYRDEGGKEMKLVGEFEGSRAETFHTLDVLDINGDKQAEICVTSAINDTLQSFILQYKDGAFHFLARGLPWYLRAVRIPEKGEVLLAQRMGAGKDFDGPIRVVEAKGDKIKIGQRLKQGKKGELPKEAAWNLAFNSGRLTAPDAAPSFLVVDEMSTVKMMDNEGSTQWKSSDDISSSDNTIDRPTVLADRVGTANPFPRRIYLPLRMVVKDMDNDGVDDVIAVINKFLTGTHIERIRVYDYGYVTGLAWDGMGMAKAWRTQDIPGYVADFQVRDVDNDGRDELVVVAVSSHATEKGAKGLLMVFELYE